MREDWTNNAGGGGEGFDLRKEAAVVDMSVRRVDVGADEGEVGGVRRRVEL